MNRKRTYFIVGNVVVILCFLAAYRFNRIFMIFAAVLSVVIIIAVRDIKYAMAELLFLLPFSATMNLSDGTTSLFILPKIIVILLFLKMNKNRLRANFVKTMIIFISFAFVINCFREEFNFMRIINLILWFFIAYILIETGKRNIRLEGFAFISGVIVSGIVGLFKEFIPTLSQTLISSQYLNEKTGELVQRFAGLWNDPNGYTCFIICALFVLLWEYRNRFINFKTFIIIGVVLSVLGLATLSKSCVLLLAVFWIYYLVFQKEISMRSKVLSISIIVVCLVLSYSKYVDVFEELIYRFTKGTSSAGINLATLTTDRSTIWKDYLSAIWNGNIFLGQGIDAPMIGGRGCHNTYIQLLYEWGILGALIYLITWINTISVAIKRRQFNYIPLIIILLLVMFLSSIYIEFFYFLLPLMICAGGNIYERENQHSIMEITV